MSQVKIGGSMVALVTPMHSNGQLDLPAYRALIDWHIAEGTNAIVVVGTSGESPTVSLDENAELISIAVEHCKKRIPVIAGAGANSTAEAIALSQHAEKVGADAILSVVPYYNKPTQEGLYQHFKSVAEKVTLPIILYNVPGRTVADLQNATVLRCAQIENIIGIKDATGDIGRGIQLIQQAPSDFAIYSGDDSTAAALILMGAQGNISVTANVAPRLMSQLCAAASQQDVATVRAINRKLGALNSDLFLEANPIPVKWALAAMGKIPLGYRLPLTPLSEVHHPRIREALSQAGIDV